MRFLSDLFLALGILLAALLAVNASDVAMHLAVKPEGERYLLVAGAIAFALVWGLVWWMSGRIDRQDVDARVGRQRGREAGAKLRQKSVDLEDRQDALEEYVSTADARRAVRRWIVIEVVMPYVLLLCISATVLFLALKSMGAIP